MGCGTGILGILASRLGAASVIAIDHEEWAWENTRENTAVNGIQNLEVLLGSQDSIPAGPFDMILSNITRNMNMELLPVYRNILSPGGFAILSGFYTADLDEIIREGSSLQLHPLHQLQLHHWTAIILKNTENIHA
jgi:ribosomal protein L11 methyltransferase